MTTTVHGATTFVCGGTYNNWLAWFGGANEGFLWCGAVVQITGGTPVFGNGARNRYAATTDTIAVVAQCHGLEPYQVFCRDLSAAAGSRAEIDLSLIHI